MNLDRNWYRLLVGGFVVATLLSGLWASAHPSHFTMTFEEVKAHRALANKVVRSGNGMLP